MTAYETKQMMYNKYFRELEQYMDDSAKIKGIPDEHIKLICDEYINSPNVSWKNIFNDKNEIVGFLLMGKDYEDDYIQSDYFILEAYVLPEWRRKGLMSERMKRYINNHPGKYAALIYTKNKNAATFWNHIFESNGFKAITTNTESTNIQKNIVIKGWEK